MEYVYSIMMFCMAGGLLLYAGLLALAKDPMLIPKHWAAKMDNKKEYCLMIAKVVAVIAIPFAAISDFTYRGWLDRRENVRSAENTIQSKKGADSDG